MARGARGFAPWMCMAWCITTVAAAAPTPLYKDASAPIPSRVKDLMARMTNEEKAAQLVMRDGGGAGASIMRKLYTNTSFGSYGLANWPTGPNDTATSRNALQAVFYNQSRLGIPVSFFDELLHSGGIGATVFPMPVSQASAWDPQLVQDIASAIAATGRAFGVDIAFCPVVNLWTDPRFGRLQEGFSSNPTISAHLAVAAVKGLQGTGPQSPDTPLASNKILSLAKHYLAPAQITNRSLLEVYAKPWRAYAKAGGRGFMASHNTVNDVPAHANEWAIKRLLRQEFGFGDGIGCSDCNDIGVLTDFGVAVNNTYAAALGLKAGVDNDLQCGKDESQWSYSHALQALSMGLIAQTDLDTAVKHVLTAKFAAGLFDNPFVDPSRAAAIANNVQHQALALNATDSSIVLLHNDGVLPLRFDGDGGVKRVAVVGPMAGCDATDADTIANTLGSYTQYSPSVAVPLMHESVVAAVPSSVTVGCVVGASAESGATTNSTAIAAAAAAVAASDVAIVALGDTLRNCGEWGDTDDLDLPGDQLELLSALAATNTALVYVLTNGRPVTFGPGNALLDAASAVLETWRPGQTGPTSAARIMAGVVNPSGKLAHSFPRSTGQVRGGGSPWLQHIRGKWIANNRGTPDADGRRYDPYNNADSTPLFYFGYGLSYTTFEYSSMSAVASGNADAPVTVRFTVTNTGSTAGTEVAQVYVKDPVGVSIAVRFWKRLAGFARVPLAAGEATTVAVDVLHDDVAFYDDDMHFTIPHGVYTFSVGGCSNTDALTDTVTL